MSGLRGDRSGFEIFILSSSAKVDHEWITNLKSAGLLCGVAVDVSDIPARAKVVLNGAESDPRSIPLGPVGATILQARLLLQSAHGVIRIGIDPGKTVGLAVMVGSHLISTDSFDLSIVESKLDDVRVALQGRASKVFIGDGDPDHRQLIESAVTNLDFDHGLVSEFQTSRPIAWIRNRHEAAAIRIALRGE